MVKRKAISIWSCILILSAVAGSGCATLFKGKTRDVTMDSQPQGVKVYLDGSLLGTTPVQLKLISKQSYTFEFRQDGYITKTVSLQSKVGGQWVVLDILGAVVPVIIDASTGAWYELEPDNVHLTMEKTQTLTPAKKKM